jgi:hypothetical protein
VFRFSGGSRDGQLIRSDDPQAAKEVQAYWTLTWNGTVGRRFDAPSPNVPALHRYQVKSKHEAGDAIYVTCVHVD